MQEHEHMCGHPTCYKNENETTMYRVESRCGEGAFTVCGRHLIERDIERASAIVTAKPASRANAEILESLKNE